MEEKYVRDENSKAILSKDVESLKQYRSRKRLNQGILKDINNIKGIVSDLLKRIEILEKNSGNSNND